ncbi:MAG: hypothetical protein M1820_004753 [Bogoriella megaspora]|nr:MAG: hypothetical protein M1820_004753 [Bogoriella megaspora]
MSQFAVYPSLKDKVVVISGGATGIGGSMTEEFARQGSKVVFLDIQDEEGAKLSKRLVDEKVAHEPIYYSCNLLDIDGAVKPIAAKILEQFPQVHALINNAAADTRQSTLDITVEQWDKGVNINLRHQFFLTQALLPGLISTGNASVINMGSINWAIPGVGLVPYTTSKSAVVGLTKTLANEFGSKGVRVNSIMPGAIATEKQLRDIITPQYEKEILAAQAIKRMIMPNEVSRMALWLIADDSSAVTNQSIVVDGGWI